MFTNMPYGIAKEIWVNGRGAKRATPGRLAGDTLDVNESAYNFSVRKVILIYMNL